MRSPLKSYLELVDGAAFDIAESGSLATPYRAPFAPLLLPWAIGGPLLALLPLSSAWATVVFGATVAASVICWGAVGWFWYRRVERHRAELGVSVERLPRAFAVLLVIALTLSVGVAFLMAR